MDCCVHLCCESCALCQEYKELETRGFNMAKGLSTFHLKSAHRKAIMIKSYSASFICRMGRKQQDGGVCARHESTRKARDVLLEYA